MADLRPEQAQPEASPFRPGTIVDGRYRVLRLIGGGGNGLVHEVEHVRTGQRLALKSLLDPTTYQRLEQEARAASILKSNRAVKIVDMGMSPTEGPYLVMELLAGQSLRELLHDAGQLPLELTVNVALQVGECLAEAHAVGIVHRDLKPDNIHLGAGPRPGLYDVKVLDFGIVKIADDSGGPGGLTRTGSTVGTPYYMSLEQLRNPSGVDGRSDLYSLGVVLYECLTGRKPYDADTIGDLVFALCSGPPTDLARLRPDVPPPVSRAIMRALSPEREDRQESVVDLCRELAAYGDRSLTTWLTDPPRPQGPSGFAPTNDTPLAPPEPHSPFAKGGAPTPSGVRPKMNSEATQAYVLGDGPAPSPAPPPNAWGSGSPARPNAPRPAAGRAAMPSGPADEPTPALPEREDRDEPRDTPTTFFVKGKHADPSDSIPDSAKTQMLEPSQGQRQYARPSENIDDPPTAPVKPSDLAAARGAPGPASASKYTKTAQLDTSQFPELSALSGPPTAPVPPGVGFGPPPVPPSSGVFPTPGGMNPQAGASGVFGAPGLRPPPMPGSLMTSQQNMPAIIPGTNMPGSLMTSQQNMPAMNIPGTNMPGSLMMSQQNMPAMNIPGTTGPLPMGQPSWMATPGQNMAPPPAGGGLMGLWRNASPKTQLIIAVGSATGLVALLLILLWVLVR